MITYLSLRARARRNYITRRPKLDRSRRSVVL